MGGPALAENSLLARTHLLLCLTLRTPPEYFDIIVSVHIISIIRIIRIMIKRLIPTSQLYPTVERNQGCSLFA